MARAATFAAAAAATAAAAAGAPAVFRGGRVPDAAPPRTAAAAATAAAGTLTLDPYVVVVSPGEGPAFSLAMADVSANLYTVTGVAPIVVAAPPAAGSLPPGTTVLYFGTTAAAPWLEAFALPGGCTGGWEAHCVAAFPAGSAGAPGGYAAVVSTGAGVRGAIFGAYTFTDVVLGFKPLFLFTDTPPAFVGAAGVVINATLAVSFAPPRFKYRAPFINDEDLTGGARPDPLGRNVFDLASWDIFFQTSLRLKANMILIGTNPFPDDTATALASRRGLVCSQHHYDLVGANVFSWPLPSQDWNWQTNAGTMSHLWRSAIAAQGGYEMVWSIGLRGLNDMPYPQCNGGNDAGCGRDISNALSNQTAWIRATPGQENATLMLYLWQEMLPLLANGYLTVPPGTNIVFTDAGVGYVRLDGNWSQYAAGVYYHTAMLDGTANQLTEMIPVSRVAQQLLNVVTYSNSTTIFVDNVSDLKPAPMTSLAVFDLAWNPEPWNATQDFDATAHAWYAKFGVDYVGLAPGPAADAYASLWDAYFSVPYLFNGTSDNLLVQLVLSSADAISADWVTGAGVSPATVAKAEGNLGRMGGPSALSAMAAVNASAWALLPSVPAARVGFYASHVLVQLATHVASLTALSELIAAASALSPAAPGGPAPSPAAGAAHVANALASFNQLLALRRVTEGDAGAWAGTATPMVNIPAAWPLRAYFLADELSDMNSCIGALNTLRLALAAPAHTPLLPVRQPTWYQFEDYQRALAPAYPLAAFNPAWAFALYTRVNCRVSDVTAGTCENAPDGGAFTRGSAAAVTLQIMTSLTEPEPVTREAMRLKAAGERRPGAPAAAAAAGAPGLVIRYTTDGSVPTPASPAYVPGSPPALTSLLPPGSAAVNVTAMAWIDGVATGVPTYTSWVAR
jgi:hypothetical protein